MYKFKNHYILNMCVVLTAFMLCVADAYAQSRFNPEQHVHFYAKESTALASVIQKYLINEHTLQEIVALNPGLDPARIHPRQAVILPRKWLRYTQTQAQVSYLRCNTEIKLKDSNALLKTGSFLKQGDVLEIPTQCQLSIQFQDESTIRMPSGGMIKISLLRTNPFESTPEVNIELLDGRIDVNVSKKGRADGTFEVRTPKSVAGVRGTNFRVGFDALNSEGQVEVSKGLVSARGLSDKAGKSLHGQFGIAMSNTGKSGEVEPLPEATSLSSVQTQHDPEWVLIVFNSSTDADKYLLSEYSNANLTDVINQKTLTSPRYLSTQALPTATFLQWTPTKENGLQGDSRVFGVCDGLPAQQPYRCDVRFNLAATYNANLRIYKTDALGHEKLFLKNTKPMRNLNDAVVRSMLAGKYRWEISYQATPEDPTIFKQTGKFELLTVVRP